MLETSTPIVRPKVHLASLAGADNPTLQRLAATCRRWPPASCTLTANAADADILLMVESGYIGLGSVGQILRLQRRSVAQVYVLSESDWPFAYLPGLYCSLSRPVPWAHSWAYLLEAEEPLQDPSGPPKYDFSFVGRFVTHPVRRRLAQLDTETTPCVDLEDASIRFSGWDPMTSYRRVMADSRFVLCPRGIGASSIRIFEVLRAGRVPVVISDAWIPPPVGDWAAFSLRVAEAEIGLIPSICLAHRDAAPRMGELGRRTFETFFAPQRFLDAALDVMRSRAAGATTLASTLARASRALSLREAKTAVRDLLNTGRLV